MSKNPKPITVIGASAGTGKTFRLATDFTKSLADGRASCPTEIIATTFTNKAAYELASRIRQFLLQDGKWTEAQSTLTSLIGTVNSVCGRMVSDLAIDAGLSPSVRIVAEDRQTAVFKSAVESVVNEYRGSLRQVIQRLSKEPEWWDEIIKLADMARQNNIGPDALIEMGKSSWTSYQTLLPAASGGLANYHGQLKAELDATLSRLPGDSTKKTQDATGALKEISQTLDAMNDISWQSIVKISKVDPGKGSAAIVQNLKELARQHLYSQSFHDDIESYINGQFRCAADCLSVYKQFKAERGLLDFIDQEYLAFSLLKNREISEGLASRFSALFVDEFQDTSPIQLAVFLELAALVNDSTWVGDEKQSIFGFRGADPLLMQQVIQQLVPATGGTRDNLATSYRSRPKLVNFANCIFSQALQPLGMLPETIEVQNVARSDGSEMSEALHVWWLEGSNQELAGQSLARGVLSILKAPDNWIVQDVKDKTTRPAIGSDIAILCRSNLRRVSIADQLSRLGILVSTERSGLLHTAESILSIAVLRYLADRYDTIAMAEIIRFSDTNEQQKRHWLYELMEKGATQISENNPALMSLDTLRDQLTGLTPVECFQLATTAPLVLETILRWGKQRQRLLNLEALVGLAQSYQDVCSTERHTASISGLITYLTTSCQDALQPPNPDEHAVQILTYHKAKGLEWPIVVLADLEEPRATSAFDEPAQETIGTFDPSNPLTGRSIRYWPNPYGAQLSNTELNLSSQQSSEFARASLQRTAENLRLLYVGVTRARDYLILAGRASGRGPGWLHMAQDETGASLFQLDAANLGNQQILRQSPEITARCSLIGNTAPDEDPITHSCTRYESLPRAGASNHSLPFACIPSKLKLSSSSQNAIVIEKRILLGERLPISTEPDMRLLGDALHLFLATDKTEELANKRLERAHKITIDFRISSLQPAQFVEASTRLRRKLDELYPGATWLTEWPVTGRHGTQRIKGTLDLLLEMPNGFVIVDHKSFPGAFDTWERRAIEAYPQLDAYATLVQNATSKPVIASYIHMPIGGALLQLKSTADWTSEESPELGDSSWSP